MSLFKLPCVTQIGAADAEDRGDELLDGRLAAAARDGDHRDARTTRATRAPSRRTRGASRAPRLCGSGDVGEPSTRARRRHLSLSASSTKSLPSNRSPGIATNSEPGRERARVRRHGAEATDRHRRGAPAPRARPLRAFASSRSHPEDLGDDGTVAESAAAPRRRAAPLRDPCPRRARRRRAAPARSRSSNRRAPVVNDVDARVIADADANLAHDRGRILAARVVVGQHDPVREIRRDGAHQRPLAAVAIAAAAEHARELADDARASSVVSTRCSASGVCA